ncbi:MAG: AMP-binding protein [Thermodesulfobacteriota bacterium]|nr:AMP-binding protein [Thermodesulfobacteriota bacterium]
MRDIIQQSAEQYGDKTFLNFYDEKYSFREIRDLSNQIANGLIQLGVKKGDHVCIMMDNRPNYILSWFALNTMGAVMVPVNVFLKGEGLTYIIDHCDAETIIVGQQVWSTLNDIRPELKKLKRIIIDRGEEGDRFEMPTKTIDFSEIITDDKTQPKVTLSENDIGRILYTSGTTGVPKGVLIKMGPRKDRQGLGNWYKPEDIIYTCLPLFHGNAQNLSTIPALNSGASLALGRRFSASRFWDEARQYNANWTSFLGTMISILHSQPEKPEDKEQPIRTVVAAATPKEIWKEFEDRFNLKIIEGYGSADGVGGMLNVDGRVGSIGKPLPSCEAKVVDDEGNEVGPDNVGELLLRPKDPELRKLKTFVHYYKNEDATLNKTEDGWVKSGDYVFYDSEGYFYFADRKNDFMRRRGENISSWEVENIINKHPDVLESAVFGVKSGLGEDDVMAIVVTHSTKELEPLDVVKWCEKRMAYFMVPRYIEFMDELPKTGTHRVKKVELKNRGVTDNTWDLENSGHKVKR